MKAQKDHEAIAELDAFAEKQKFDESVSASEFIDFPNVLKCSSGRLILPILLLFFTVFIINHQFYSSDPGLLTFNPSPYALFALIFGILLGFGFSLLGLLATFAAVLFLKIAISDSFAPLSWIFEKDAFRFFAGMTIFWLFGVFARQILLSCQNLASKNFLQVRAKMREKSSEARVLQKSLLEQSRTNRSVKMREELFLETLWRALRAGAGDEQTLQAAIFDALDERYGICGVAFYKFKKGTSGDADIFARESFRGCKEEFPSTLLPGFSEIIFRALRKKKSINLLDREMEDIDEDENYLLAIPWFREKTAPRVLVINSAPYRSLRKGLAAEIELLLQFLAEKIKSNAKGVSPLANTREIHRVIVDFEKTIGAEIKRFRPLNLPSSLLLFKMESKKWELWRDFSVRLESEVQNGDVIWKAPDVTDKCLALWRPACDTFLARLLVKKILNPRELHQKNGLRLKLAQLSPEANESEIKELTENFGFHDIKRGVYHEEEREINALIVPKN